MREGYHLCYITDRHSLAPGPLLPRLIEAVGAGIDMVQIREKDLGSRELLHLVRETLKAVCDHQPARSRVVVNDRLDVALAVEAHGVHLGRRSMPAEVVRAMVPESFLVGASCHSVEEALEAEASGADYILLGPIFPTPSKLAYGPPLGLSLLQAATRRVTIPVLALGGITPERVKPCLEAGAAGIAGIRLFQECDQLEARVRDLRAEFARSAGPS